MMRSQDLGEGPDTGAAGGPGAETLLCKAKATFVCFKPT